MNHPNNKGNRNCVKTGKIVSKLVFLFHIVFEKKREDEQKNCPSKSSNLSIHFSKRFKVICSEMDKEHRTLLNFLVVNVNKNLSRTLVIAKLYIRKHDRDRFLDQYLVSFIILVLIIEIRNITNLTINVRAHKDKVMIISDTKHLEFDLRIILFI